MLWNQENDLRKTSSIRISQHASPLHGFQAFYLEKKTTMCESVCSTNHLSDMYRFLSQHEPKQAAMLYLLFFIYFV